MTNLLARDIKVKELYEQGRTASEIATALGYASGTISNIITRLGLTREDEKRTRWQRGPISPIHKELGEKLRRIRVLSFGGKVKPDISTQRLNQIEDGICDITLLDMLKMMKAYNIQSIHDLLDFLP
jgi:hypothetical protein